MLASKGRNRTKGPTREGIPLSPPFFDTIQHDTPWFTDEHRVKQVKSLVRTRERAPRTSQPLPPDTLLLSSLFSYYLVLSVLGGRLLRPWFCFYFFFTFFAHLLGHFLASLISYHKNRIHHTSDGSSSNSRNTDRTAVSRSCGKPSRCS